MKIGTREQFGSNHSVIIDDKNGDNVPNLGNRDNLNNNYQDTLSFYLMNQTFAKL